MTDRDFHPSQSDIERVVMRRVHTARLIRPLVSPEALALLALAIALWALGREVWVARVFANGPQDLLGHSRYLLYAFEHTRLAVQALTLATLGSLIYLARAAARPLAELLTRALYQRA